MSDQPKVPTSLPPVPTDEIDEEWTGGTGAAKAEPAAPVTAKAESGVPAGRPVKPTIQDENDDDDDDDDDDEAHSKSTRPESPGSDAGDLIPNWGPWAVLGVLMVLGLVGGLGGLGGIIQLENPRPEPEPAPTPSVAAAVAPRPTARTLPSAQREVDPQDRETIEASHLLVSYQGARRAQPTVTRTKEEAKKRAEQAAAKAKKKNANFEKLVAEYSDEPRAAERAGKLGAFTRRRMAKEFSDAAFALQPGQISGVVETPFGFHVIHRTK